MKKVGRYFVPDDETLQLDALAVGGWQLDHLDAALEHVKKWDCAIDGGAHIGSWTIAMAGLFGMVHAFEPSPDTYDALRANTHHLTNVRSHQLALGEARGTAGMREDEKYGNGGNTGGRFLSGTGTVEIMPLDEIEFDAVDFIKLDVEGYELFALKGAHATLLEHRPVVMIEDKHRMAFRFDLQPHAAVRYLVELGMKEVRTIGADRVFTW